MLSTYASQTAAAAWPFLIVCVLAGYLLRNKYFYGISKYPGPAVAAFTDWWRFWNVHAGHAEDTHITLHRRLGDVVRLGPNVLSFADPAAIKDIYGLGKGFEKTEFYRVRHNVIKGHIQPNVFSTNDEAWHSKFRRATNSAFTLSSLVTLEPLVNSTISVFLRTTLDRYCNTEQVCSFAEWLQFYAFDVIGEISFSKRFGFIETGKDVRGIIGLIQSSNDYSGPVGQQPWLDQLLEKNPIKLMLMRLGLIQSSNPTTVFAAEAVESRPQLDMSLDGHVDDEKRAKGVDMFERFQISQKQHPDFMSDRLVLLNSIALVAAGSDTTGISLSAVFYHLLKNPRIYNRLMEELDAAVADTEAFPSLSQASDEHIISWHDAQKLRYLDACIQEAFRLHPAVGLLLERYVPAGGAVIAGHHIPAGTIVGCNAWVLHRRQEVFGEDADEFRPERWLLLEHGGTATAESLKAMKGAMLHFGSGSRTCIGRNISLLEMYKLVPTFLLRFRIDNAMADGQWRTHNTWFVKQLGFDVRFSERTSPA